MATGTERQRDILALPVPYIFGGPPICAEESRCILLHLYAEDIAEVWNRFEATSGQFRRPQEEKFSFIQERGCLHRLFT